MHMNCLNWFCLALIGISLFGDRGDAAPRPGPVVSERGPHHRTWKTSADPAGARAATWTELGTGIHYFDGGEWKESRAEFVLVNGRAAALRGQHRVTLAANLNSPGAVELVAPDGKRFRSHFAGLAYTDAASGRSVLIAEPVDCVGTVAGANQVIYENAFSGACEGDIRYTYTLGAFEQDILLLKAPPSPEAYALPRETTRLEAWTEFIEIPTETQTASAVRRQPDRARAKRMQEPDLIDQHLNFGAMQFVQGRAFPLQQSDPFASGSVPTGKSLERIGGRTFLIEKVDYTSVRPALDRLPQMAAAAAAPTLRLEPIENRHALAARICRRPIGAPGFWRDRQTARVEAGSAKEAYVIDYLAVNGSLTNFTFSHDQTYLIRTDLDLFGTTVLEGAVVKFAPGASMSLWGALECRTTLFQPAILTARDDDSVGAVLPVSTGRPAGTYAGSSLACRSTAGRYDLHDVHLRHAATGIAAHENVRVTLAHAQITRSRTAVAAGAGAEVACRNVLVGDVATAFRGPPEASIACEHATLHRASRMADTPPVQLALTNSLLVAVTNLTAFLGSHTVVQSSDAGAFVTAGGGRRYLAARSGWRNAGTAAIDPGLRTQLRGRTTHAPLILTEPFVRDVVLRPQALRDTDVPDLGYHYAPLDYCWGGLRIAGARVTLTNGVAIGLYPAGLPYGIGLDNAAQLIAGGHPDNLTRLVRSGAIQEEAPAPGAHRGPFNLVQTLGDHSIKPRVEWRFVESVLPGGADSHVSSSFRIDDAPFAFRDCQFIGGGIHAGDTGISLVNCLLDRLHITLDASADDPVWRFHQNLFRGGRLEAWLSNQSRGEASNNLFDQTAITNRGGWVTSHNAHLAGHAALLPTHPTDRVLTSAAYQSGPLGSFYYPAQGGPGTLASLINAGSASAASLGLAHYSTLPTQVPEGSTPVDIGFHYVAATRDGQPLDSDSDGVPDWREDADGNGQRTAPETDWLRYDSRPGYPGRPAFEVFTPLR